MITRGVLFGFAIVTAAVLYVVLNDRSEKHAVAKSVLHTDRLVADTPVPSIRPPIARIPAQTVTELPASVSPLIKELDRLQRCYETECGYDRSYPQAYGYAVGREIKRVLIDLAVVSRTQHIQLSEIARVARHHLENDDGHVKEGALRLLATQEPSSESLHSILNHVIGDTDAQLIEPALYELRRYTSPTDRAFIHEKLSASLLTGAPFVAEKISQNLAPFLDSASYTTYSQAAARASEGSRIRSNLRAQLSDYQKRQSGG